MSLSKTVYPQLNTGSTKKDGKLSQDDCKIVGANTKKNAQISKTFELKIRG